MPYHWERPTPEQLARGIVAVYVLTYRVNVAKRASDTPIWHDIEMPTPYNELFIARRQKNLLRRYGGDIEARQAELPRWIQPIKPAYDIDIILFGSEQEADAELAKVA